MNEAEVRHDAGAGRARGAAGAGAPRQLGEPVAVWDARAELGEGLCWSVRERALYWVDILGQRLHRFDPTSGDRKSWRFDETISAVAERASKPGLVVALRHRLAHFDPNDGATQPQPVEPHEIATPSNRFNDGKCDAAGRFWVGSMDFGCKAPTGAIYRFDGSTTAWTRALNARFVVTNGPTWSLDGRTMYVNDTVRRDVHAFDFDPASGALSNDRVWLRLARNDGFPDGMTTDAAGRVWIAHWGASCVTCHAPDTGSELARIALPTRHISNVAFGGDDLRTLYITSARSDLTEAQLAAEPLAGALFAVESDVPGLAPHRFAG